MHTVPFQVCDQTYTPEMALYAISGVYVWPNITGGVSHHNYECSRAYKAPDKVCVQTQPAPKDGGRDRENVRNSRRTG